MLAASTRSSGRVTRRRPRPAGSEGAERAPASTVMPESLPRRIDPGRPPIRTPLRRRYPGRENAMAVALAPPVNMPGLVAERAGRGGERIGPGWPLAGPTRVDA